MAVNLELTESFFNSVGVLQRDAPLVQTSPAVPVTAWSPDQIDKNRNDLQCSLSIVFISSFTVFSKEIATKIITKCKEIDSLIEKIPAIDVSEDEQLDKIKQLDQENVIMFNEMNSVLLDAGLLVFKLLN